MPRLPGATPGLATSFGRVRKLAKRRGREPRDFVGSTPTSVTKNDSVVQRRRHLRDMQETMVQLHPGSLIEEYNFGLPCERCSRCMPERS